MSLQAQWKVATANMKELFNTHPETVKYRTDTAEKTKLIDQDARAKSIKDKTTELEATDKEGQRLVNDFNKLTTTEEKTPASEKIRTLLEKRRITEQELNSLKQEFSEFRKEKMLQINQESAARMRQILAEINAHIAQYATTHNFDAVYDNSGYTNTGLQVIVYVKPGLTTDITEEIQKIINPKKDEADQQKAPAAVPQGP